MSSLSSIVTLTENCDDDEIVSLMLQANTIDKLLGIVSSNEDSGVLYTVYSLLARLTCVSAVAVSKMMVPPFFSKSLSLISQANDDLTLQVLHVLYHSALAGDDFCAFEVGNDVTAHLLRYLLACQPISVGRNERSCCGTLKLEEGQKQTVATSLLLLTKLIKVLFPGTLHETAVAACVPYFLSSDRRVQLLALKYARHLVTDLDNEHFLKSSLPNNQMNAENTTWIPVLNYLIDLVKEKQMDFEQNVKVFHVFRRMCADFRNQLGHPNGMTQPEISCLETVEDDMMTIFQYCLKTIGAILAIFGEIAYLSEAHEQIVIDTGIYPLLGELLDWSIVVTSDGIPLPSMSAEEDYEYFRAAVTTDSQLDEPFHLLTSLKAAFRQHNLRPPLSYQDSIRTFTLDDILDNTLSIDDAQRLKRAKDSLLKNVLFFLGNSLGGTPAHAEIVLSSLFPDMSATEATMKVVDCLQTILLRLPQKSLKELMRCIYVLASLPPEHQSVLAESEMMLLAWNHRMDLNSDAASLAKRRIIAYSCHASSGTDLQPLLCDGIKEDVPRQKPGHQNVLPPSLDVSEDTSNTEPFYVLNSINHINKQAKRASCDNLL
ncbi:hypothetical protein BLNAU_10428 [Blattamonas nauphoetae]|uniref:Uncharacterized protein n=1 Tax=Blattamonas nauphoetae TaxID=2049346 RepID=A0ABQ9XQ71_9EUKA|nr:hypothetical protein BLNAU_10428 [Blattamonas nauphoetae]